MTTTDPALRAARAREHVGAVLLVARAQVRRSTDAWMRGDARLAAAVIAEHRSITPRLERDRPPGGPRTVARANSAALDIGDVALQIAQLARVTPRDARQGAVEGHIGPLRDDVLAALAAARAALAGAPSLRDGGGWLAPARRRLQDIGAATRGQDQGGHPGSLLVARHLLRAVADAAEIVDLVGPRGVRVPRTGLTGAAAAG